MRWLLAILTVLMCASARCDEAAAAPDAVPAQGSTPAPDIVAVLYRSQQLQLDAMPLADPTSERAARIRDSFASLTLRLRAPSSIELRIVRGAVVAETMHGNIVVANERLGDLPEGERLFVLAHELGHVTLGHWAQVGRLYKKWIPGEVVKAQTDAVANQMSREASALAHQQEYEADAFGLRTLRSLGLSEEDVVAAFRDLGVISDTATHPGTRKRVSALRSIEVDDLQAGVPPGSMPTH
jgi:Zn-dependent protease with chaperone function